MSIAHSRRVRPRRAAAALLVAALIGATPLLAPSLGAQEAVPGADSTATLAARTVTLVGVVRDTAGLPLSGAEVRAGARQFTLTGEDGRFQLMGVAPDTIQLLVRRIGYKPADVILEAQAGLRVELAVKLIPAVTELGTIEVEGERMDLKLWKTGFYHRQKLGWGTFFDSDYLEHFGGTISGLLYQVPGLRVARDRHGRAIALGRTFSLTGGGSCALNVFLDGMLIRWADEVGLDYLVNPEEILAVEVYPRVTEMPAVLSMYAGGTPTMGGGLAPGHVQLKGVTYADCGAIVIWTKPFGADDDAH
ncbi:MAG TPA: carboxypeptidase-like regulatory domain-containing protein [Gemmatimonadaceae bacterium]|nr:carboxypeptidase-like regulatory domain-containing protein [Gemmatimonadaceae bacterium]